MCTERRTIVRRFVNSNRTIPVINRSAVYRPLAACLVAALAAPIAAAQGGHDGADSSGAAVAVERFHRAIGAGDTIGAAALLDPEAIILESGDLETKAEYLRNHLPADIAFARAVRSTRRVVKATRQGDVAWVSSTSRATGTFEKRRVDSDGAELMVLRRSAQGWRISAIHWSSHPHRR
jgi:ketosteroid isomerase-like protein